MNIVRVILSLCLPSLVTYMTYMSNFAGQCEGNTFTESEEKIEQLEQQLTSTVHSLQTETDKTLKEMIVKYSRYEREMEPTVDTLKTAIGGELARVKQVEQRLNSTITTLQTAEKKFQGINENLSRIDQTLNSAKRVLNIGSKCELLYKWKCFRAIFHKNDYVDFAAVEQMCNNGWKLANIYSRDHYDAVGVYIREKFDREDFVIVRLGMTYDPNKRKLYLSNGTQLTEKLPWYPGWLQQDVTYNTMIINVNEHSTSIYQGISNIPGSLTMPGALCEI